MCSFEFIWVEVGEVNETFKGGPSCRSLKTSGLNHTLDEEGKL
jgi:hypothetical protein